MAEHGVPGMLPPDPATDFICAVNHATYGYVTGVEDKSSWSDHRCRVAQGYSNGYRDYYCLCNTSLLMWAGKNVADDCMEVCKSKEGETNSFSHAVFPEIIARSQIITRSQTNARSKGILKQ